MINEDLILRVAAYFQHGGAVARTAMRVVLGFVTRYLNSSPRNAYEDIMFSAVTAMGGMYLSKWQLFKRLVLP